MFISLSIFLFGFGLVLVPNPCAKTSVIIDCVSPCTTNSCGSACAMGVFSVPPEPAGFTCKCDENAPTDLKPCVVGCEQSNVCTAWCYKVITYESCDVLPEYCTYVVTQVQVCKAWASCARAAGIVTCDDPDRDCVLQLELQTFDIDRPGKTTCDPFP